MKKDNDEFKNWNHEYSWGNCELDNRQYGQYLSAYIRNQETPLVLNIDGEWGTGKTHFLRQLYRDLRFEHKYPVIYINAWESDFSNDPLLVIISEMLAQLKNLHDAEHIAKKEEELLKTVSKYAKRVWNATSVGVATYIGNQIEDTTLLEVAKQVTFRDEEHVKLGRNLTESYASQKQALSDTKTALKHFLELFDSDKRKLFVLIDELDRCRPNYAIELLETVKHFFELENYLFVVATDTQQLSHSIQAVYGHNFDGKEYLSRFFSRTAQLPLPDKHIFVKSRLEVNNTLAQLSTLATIPKYSEQEVIDDICTIANMYNLSLRKLDQMITKFDSIIQSSLSKTTVFSYIQLFILLVEFDSPYYKDAYELRKNVVKKNLEYRKYSAATNSTSGADLNQLQLNQLFPGIGNEEIKWKFEFAWGFINLFSPSIHNIPLKAMQIINIEDTITRAKQRYPTNARARDCLSKTFNTLEEYDKKGFSCLNKPHYFNAVELASYIS